MSNPVNNELEDELGELYNPSINDIMLNERNDEDRPVIYLDSAITKLNQLISNREIEARTETLKDNWNFLIDNGYDPVIANGYFGGAIRTLEASSAEHPPNTLTELQEGKNNE